MPAKKIKYSYYIRLAVLSAAVLVIFSNCSKAYNVKWVNYLETRCADKWDRTPNNELLKNNIVEYCDSKGIKIFELEIFVDSAPETCQDCTCKTGRRVRAKVSKRDLNDIKKEGFYE